MARAHQEDVPVFFSATESGEGAFDTVRPHHGNFERFNLQATIV